MGSLSWKEIGDAIRSIFQPIDLSFEKGVELSTLSQKTQKCTGL